MKKILVLLIMGLTSTYSNATEVCRIDLPQSNSATFFLFNNGLQAVCQRAKNEITNDNKNLCANDSFFMTGMQNSSVSGSMSIFSSYSTGVSFTNKQTSKSRTISLDKVYRIKVLSGVKEILIQPGTYVLNCPNK